MSRGSGGGLRRCKRPGGTVHVDTIWGRTGAGGAVQELPGAKELSTVGAEGQGHGLWHPSDLPCAHWSHGRSPSLTLVGFPLCHAMVGGNLFIPTAAL